MRGRSWRWLRGRIFGLLNAPVLGYREVAADGNRTRLEPLWSTRLQSAMYSTNGG